MTDRKELAGSWPYSALVEVKAVQKRAAEAEYLAEHIAETADYARRVAGSGSWHHDEVEGWEGNDDDLIGTQFLSIHDGGEIALRPKIRNRALGRSYLQLLLKTEEEESKILAVIEDKSIELPIVGKPKFHEVTSIRGLLNYIEAHTTK
jgi:hypothetical protein